MTFTRRDALALGLGATAVAMLPMRASAAADEAIAAFTGGAEVGSGDITLTAPEIAENGNTVPVSVDAPGAASIILLAAGNPTPGVATFNFGPAAGAQSASTRIRLAGTQDVVAVAKMADGSFIQASSTVKVTIGGCGG
ncbi:thiosulfate oxidation carrier protein SoxY [Aliiroseovarius subalbicans]|uniref:thiosulfate oxidation carrier protein SoxY n=1 Tax=Aliiroseovarius subalbicans TaxID=2925840 RepID=UPI001F55C0CC|nr:thiosulfate oxidation carrier protein SoxY [Aliiroseovarius subalbicans]MCI2398114.1 thiosulfate oxidation carrier protein SoxY [Aliiroseovarius subalbicans]